MSEHKSPIPSMIYNAAVGGHVTNSQQIIDENLNREQNDINQETVGSVPYNSINPNGMGRIVLKKNDNFKNVVEAQSGNTIFVIKYDFTLTGNVTVPANCVLEFEGGSINGAYTVTGQNTIIISDDTVIFTGIHISGTWNVPKIRSYWFSDITSSNRLRELINLSSDTEFNEIYIAPGTYGLYADPNEGDEDPLSDFRYPYVLSPKSNTRLIVDGDLYLSATNLTGYDIFALYHVSNIEICGSGSIQGDKFVHVGDTGESGHGVWMKRANNINIHDIYINACWGDCICIGGGNVSVAEDISTDITLKNLHLKDGRRQGISIIHAERVTIEDCYIHNVGGTNPQAGIDIEPNPDLTFTRNITIRGCRIDQCPIGILIYGQRYVSGNSDETVIDNGKNKNILIENNLITNGAGNALRIDAAYNVNINNCYFGNLSSTSVTSLVLNNGQIITIENCVFDRINGSCEFKGINCVFKKNTFYIASGASVICNWNIDSCTFEGNDNTATIDFRGKSNINLSIINMFCTYRNVCAGLTVEINNGLNNKDIITLINAVVNGCRIINKASDVACYSYAGINGSTIYGLVIENASNAVNITKLCEVLTSTTHSCINGLTFKDNVNINCNIINASGASFSFIDSGKQATGATSKRPSFVQKGFMYYDFDLRKAIYADSVNYNTGEVNIWREADGVRSDTPRVGTSSQRPNGQYNRISAGFMYYDITIDKLIIAKAVDSSVSPYTVTWVDANGASV